MWRPTSSDRDELGKGACRKESWNQVSSSEEKSQEARHAGLDVSREVESHHCSVSSMTDMRRKRREENKRRKMKRERLPRDVKWFDQSGQEEPGFSECTFNTCFEMGRRSKQVLRELLSVRGLELGCLGSNIVSLIAGCDMASTILHSPETTKTGTRHL